ALRSLVHRRARPAATARRHPPGDLRLAGTVHRGHHRALRRCVSLVARARPGRDHPDCGSTRRRRRRARRCPRPARLARRGGPFGQPDAEQDPAGPGTEGPVHAGAGRPRGGGSGRGRNERRNPALGRRFGPLRTAIVPPKDPVLPSADGRARPDSSALEPPRKALNFVKGITISRDLRVNQMIRIPQVRVVDEEGAQLGVMPTAQALAMAQERGYDLVEVAPMAAPPVVKFLDFGQYKYELTKKEKEAKRRQRSVTFKEVRLKPKIGQGDFDTKVRRAID